jgi:hypothetical protein
MKIFQLLNFKMEEISRTRTPHKDGPFFITKLNQWLQKNKEKFTESDSFELGLFYPEFAKKNLGLKPSMGEITIRPFKTKAPQNIPSDLILINVYKMKSCVPVFAEKREIFEGKITQLQFCELKTPTLSQWKESYHVNSRCKQFCEMKILDLASQMISLYEAKQIPNLQEVLCDTLWSFIGRETDEIPQKELNVFIESCFGMMFAEYEMFEELEEWLPGEVYDAISEKLQTCKKVFSEHLKKGIQSINTSRMMKLFYIMAKLSYGIGQFDRIDEPMLLGATMSGETEERFSKFWRECGGSISFL